MDNYNKTIYNNIEELPDSFYKGLVSIKRIDYSKLKSSFIEDIFKMVKCKL